jgi:type IX secretion system PorP/SprF family membrane protein
MTRVCLLVIFLLTTAVSYAQQLSLFTQYRENQTIINPAAVESDFLAYRNNITVGASYRSQWAGFGGTAPKTQTVRGSWLNAGGSGVTMMLGGQLINDQTGPTGFTGIYGRFAGILTSDPEYGGLSIGLSAGMVQYRVKSSEIVLRDENDALSGVDQGQMFPDVGVGIFYYQAVGGRYSDDIFYAGLSVPQAFGLDLTFTNEQGDFFTKRTQHFYGQVGYYKFFRNDGFLEPSMWVKYVPGAPVNVDLNLRYQLPSALWIGAGGSSAGAMHLETGFVLGENAGLSNTFRFGYGFDYNFSTFGPSTGGTHEINLTLSFQN